MDTRSPITLEVEAMQLMWSNRFEFTDWCGGRLMVHNTITRSTGEVGLADFTVELPGRRRLVSPSDWVVKVATSYAVLDDQTFRMFYAPKEELMPAAPPIVVHESEGGRRALPSPSR